MYANRKTRRANAGRASSVLTLRFVHLSGFCAWDGWFLVTLCSTPPVVHKRSPCDEEDQLLGRETEKKRGGCLCRPGGSGRGSGRGSGVERDGVLHGSPAVHPLAPAAPWPSVRPSRPTTTTPPRPTSLPLWLTPHIAITTADGSDRPAGFVGSSDVFSFRVHSQFVMML
ncbi:hypothetical protein ANANG_G00198250 [Anguilla anguilla]|uniref:Uncharacterized protein n=1 Tax=Anguilla anguilla TaxID=7936 RepID=A0A9D3RTH1_ANGAN|nr:hypothetical protein ANANG_G00198250 [Anguilla anguilla]